MTGPALYSVSVAAVVVNAAGAVLAVRRADNGDWEPPGGVLELEETIEVGLRREVLEETGLLVESPRLSGVYKNVPRGIVALVFRCDRYSGEPAPSQEAAQVRWLQRSEITTLMTEAYAVRVIDALDSSWPSVRDHDGVHLLRQDSPSS